MSQTDLVAVADKRLALAEAGGIEETHHQMPAPVRGPGIGNPAPLGLLCFGMTTGETGSPRFCSIRTGSGFKRSSRRWARRSPVFGCVRAPAAGFRPR